MGEQNKSTRASFLWKGLWLLAAGAALLLSGCSGESKKEKFLESGDRYFQEHKYAEAALEYRNVLREDPENAQAIARLGIIWLEQGSPIQSLPYLAKARELIPNDLGARMTLVEAFRALGRVEEARAEAKAVLALSVGHEEALVALAQMARSEDEISEVEALLGEGQNRTSVGGLLASAALHLQRGDQDQAEGKIAQALALAPKSVEARLARANLHVARKELKEATEQLRLASEYAPLRSNAHLQYAAAQATLGAQEEADAFLLKLTKKVPDYVPAWMLRARFASQKGDHAQCLTLLEKVFHNDPRHYDGLLLQGQTLIGLRKGEEALEVFKKFEESFPGGAAVQFEMARAALLSRNSARAFEALKTAVTRDPSHSAATLMLARLYLLDDKTAPAAELLTVYLEKRPDHAAAKTLLAEVYQSAGQSQEATAAFSEQVEADPQGVDARVRMGVALVQQGKLKEAREAFVQAQALAPRDMRITQQMVELDLIEKDLAGAHKRVQEAVRANPSSPMAHTLLGRVLAAGGSLREAEAALKKALQLDGEFLYARSILISVYASANRLDDVSRELELILASPQASERSLILAASIYQQQGKDAKAAEVYERMLKGNPNSPMAHNNLAYLYAEKLGDLSRAYSLAKKARALQPDDPVVAETLGWIHYRRGEYQVAARLLEEGLEAFSESPEVMYHVGMAYSMTGKVEEAQALLEKAARAPEDFPGKDEAKKQLANLVAGSAASIESLLAILEKEPKDLASRMRLAMAYEGQGEAVKAAEAYEKVIVQNPQLLDAVIKVAGLYAGPLADLPRALKRAQRARELAPEDPKVASLLGRLAFQNGEFLRAYTLLKENVQPPEALSDLARSAYALGKFLESEEVMKKLLKEDPDSAVASSYLELIALVRTGDALLDSKGRVASILEEDPGHGPALMAAAAVALAEGEESAAEATYREVLKRYPECTPAQVALASVLSSDSETLEESYQLAMSARRTLPESADVARILGIINYRRKEYGYAVQLLQQAQGKGPLDPEGLAYLGLAQWRSGEEAAGEVTLGKALEGELGESLLNEVREVLATGASDSKTE